MKRILTIFCVFMLVLAFVTPQAYAKSERSKIEYYDRQWFKDEARFDDTTNFTDNADITSDSKLFYPLNHIKNSGLGVWSGGTRYGVSNSQSAVPDGWYIYGQSASTGTGATRYDLADVAPGTGSTVYQGQEHSMLIGVWDPTTGAGTTKYYAYPDSGVSAQRHWYQRFAGHTVTFGCYIHRDLSQYVATGVTTNLIRPFINIGTTYVDAETYFTFGSYVEDNDDAWTLATVTYDVPSSATAFEVGLAINPTVLSASASTGDTVYVSAPFLLIDPLHKGYVPNPGEVIMFEAQLDVWGSGGSTFGAKPTAGTAISYDLSSANGFNGIVPDDVEAMYVTVGVDAAASSAMHFYGDDATGGVTIMGTGNSVPNWETLWVPVSASGTINIDNINAFTGTSLFVHGVKLR